jgi:AhpD family alkylhydroperoxidase
MQSTISWVRVSWMRTRESILFKENTSMTAAINYPEHYERLKDLVNKLGDEIPDTMSGFQQLHKNATRDEALDKTTKELIALGIAVAVRCDGCIAYHIHDALQADATRAEIMETIGISVLMGGGPALMYGAEALVALEQFTDELEPA